MHMLKFPHPVSLCSKFWRQRQQLFVWTKITVLPAYLLNYCPSCSSTHQRTAKGQVTTRTIAKTVAANFGGKDKGRLSEQ
jgi:hypothetical protein